MHPGSGSLRGSVVTITSYDVDPKVNSTRRVDPTDPTLIEPVQVGGRA